jgi:hypothetical protein
LAKRGRSPRAKWGVLNVYFGWIDAVASSSAAGVGEDEGCDCVEADDDGEERGSVEEARESPEEGETSEEDGVE